MTLHRWTPRELAVAVREGRILDLVPKKEVELRPLGGTMVEIRWPNGPRGHAIVGICPETCHFVVEYPAQWQRRGRAIAAAIPVLSPEEATRMALEDPL
jgi:hypothetical protein